MDLQVLRYRSGPDETLGLLFDATSGRRFLSYTLEDEHRTEKVYGETRIPAGRYEIKLRTEGGFHERYSKQFGDIHKGMLWLQDVPGFQWVLIHVGNTDDDTAGCLLVGSAPTEQGTITASAKAYKRVYTHVVSALLRGERVEIEYIDYDTPAEKE